MPAIGHCSPQKILAVRIVMPLQCPLFQGEIRLRHQHLLSADTIDSRAETDLDAVHVLDLQAEHDEVGLHGAGELLEDQQLLVRA